MKEIEITIGPEGETEIDLKGFHGHGCSEITDQLIEALGAKILKRVQRAEYYQPKQKTKVKQRMNL